jgi:hypothetical protein
VTIVDEYAFAMAFERLVVVDRALSGEHQVDVGRLAEDLVFYGEVRMQVGRGELVELVSGVGPEALLELMSRGVLKVAYANNVISVSAAKDGVISLYQPVLVGAEHMALERAANDVFKQAEPDEPLANKLARRFIELAEDRPHDVKICDATRDFLDDPEAVEGAVATILSADGGLPADHPKIRFRPARQEGGRFTIDTNIAFDELNDGVHLARGPLDPARLIAFFAGARSKLMLASEEIADLDTNAIDAALLTAQVDELVTRRARSVEGLFRFQEMTLGQGNAVAEAINGGKRSFKELLVVLDKAQRFREWLRDQEPEAKLLHEYYRKVTEQTWVRTLEGKVYRWLLAAASGAAIAGSPGLVVGAAMGALDTFLVDRLAAGWRPNQFVDGALRKFVS